MSDARMTWPSIDPVMRLDKLIIMCDSVHFRIDVEDIMVKTV